MSKKVLNVTVGADPELFLVNTETQKVVSSIGLIPGQKGDAWVGEGMSEGYGIETDNILAEFNIPPAKDKKSFVYSLEFMKGYIRDFVRNIDPKLDVKCSASELVDEDQLNSPEAKLFGCSVDYNAYTEDANPKPKGDTTNLRSAGFHLHLGYEDPDMETSLEMIKMCDLFIGIPSIVRDRDNRRRSLYGKAGCFRLTPYGCEYRVLSSAMYATPELAGFAYDQLMKAIDAHNNGTINLTKALQKKVRETIDSGDAVEAQKIIDQFNLV